jgi:hypothetical protein
MTAAPEVKAADQAIAGCSGDAREAVKALLVAIDFLEGRGRRAPDEGLQRLRPGTAPRGRANARMRQMAEMTYYVALPFVFTDDGVGADEATECFSANAAVMRAEALSRKPGHAGAIAFSRAGDPSSGDFSDATLIRKFGDVPDDLSSL